MPNHLQSRTDSMPDGKKNRRSGLIIAIALVATIGALALVLSLG